jgi:hypothetical protein
MWMPQVGTCKYYSLRVCSVLAQVCVFKILVQVLLAHELANIGKKNELEWGKEHWHAKI